MRKGLAMRKMSILITVSIMVAVGFQIINSLNETANDSTVEIDQLHPNIDYPYCSDFETGEKVDRGEFNKIIYYRLKGNCELPSQRVTLDFVLENKSLKSEVIDLGLKDSTGDTYLYYRDTCSSASDLNIKGVKVGKSNQRILFQKDKEVKIEGKDGEVVLC